MMTKPIISVRDLNFYYYDQLALEKISMDFKPSCDYGDSGAIGLRQIDTIASG